MHAYFYFRHACMLISTQVPDLKSDFSLWTRMFGYIYAREEIMNEYRVVTFTREIESVRFDV